MTESEHRANPFRRMKEMENRLLIVENIVAGRIKLFQDIDLKMEDLVEKVKELKGRLS